jgi:hypothetical protein
MDALATEVADLVAREGQVALQYGSAQGRPELREQICEVMALEGIRADPDDVVVTVGSQSRWTWSPASIATQAMSCSPRARPMSARSAASRHTRRGWCTSRWTRTAWSPIFCARRWPRCGRARSSSTRCRPSTPGGRHTLRRPARRGARDLSEYGAAVVGLLGFSRHTYPALRSLDREVVYLGSFSKTFASGLRVGWALAHPPCATGWCRPPNRRRSARRVSPGCWSLGSWPHTTGAARSRRTPRPTATAATPCSAPWRPTSGRLHVERARRRWRRSSTSCTRSAARPGPPSSGGRRHRRRTRHDGGAHRRRAGGRDLARARSVATVGTTARGGPARRRRRRT